jgi:peptidoglycan/xylan/chitin deacetylase (PgdA/CDA1 family)
MFIQWIILPMLMVWLVVNYVVGLLHNPQWGNIRAQNVRPVLGIQDDGALVPRYEPWEWKGKSLVSLWFDDAWSSQYLVAFPVLESRGLVAAIAVPTHLIGFEAYASWAQIKRLGFAGWEIESHSKSHNCDPDLMTNEEIQSELVGSLEELQMHNIMTNAFFVAPCGVEAENLTAVAQEYYLAQRLTYAGVNPLPLRETYHIRANSVTKTATVETIREWLQEAHEEVGWLNIIFHQIDISNEEYSTTPETFVAMMDEIAQTDLDIVLPGQVLNMIQVSHETN